MREGSFNIRKWNYNSKELIERIREIEGGNENSVGPESKVSQGRIRHTRFFFIRTNHIRT